MALSFWGCAPFVVSAAGVEFAAGVGNSHCDTGEYSVSQHQSLCLAVRLLGIFNLRGGRVHSFRLKHQEDFNSEHI